MYVQAIPIYTLIQKNPVGVALKYKLHSNSEVPLAGANQPQTSTGQSVSAGMTLQTVLAHDIPLPMLSVSRGHE